MMKMRHVYSTLLLLLLLLAAGAATATYNVWAPEDGVQIRQADHINWINAGTAMRADGSYAVVWSAATAQTQNAYIQAYDAEGNELYPAGGVQITDDGWAQNDVIVMAYGADGWIVGWRDYRNGTGKEHPGEFYLQYVNGDGSLMWDASGIAAGSEPWTSRQMYLLPSGDDYFYAAWGGFDGGFVQRFDASGTAQYAQPASITDNCYLRGVFPDADNGLVLAFEDFDSEGIIAHHMLADGTFDWGSEGVTVVADPGQFNPTYNLTTDSAGGIFVSWCFMSSEGYNDVFGQHMDSSGNLHWDNMTVIAGGAGYQHSQFLFPAGPNEFFFVWNVGAEWWYDSQIRIQKVASSAGEPTLAWGGGNIGLLLGEDEHCITSKAQVLDDGEGGAFVVWTGDDDYYNTDNDITHMKHILSDGATDWVEEAIIPDVLMCGGYRLLQQGDFLLLVNREEAPYEVSVRVRRYYIPNGAEFANEAVVAGFGGDIYRPVIRRVDESAYIAWSDLRPARQGNLPFAQRVDVLTGAAMWEDHGIPMMPGIDPEYDEDTFITDDLQVVDGGDGGTLVSWNLYISQVNQGIYQPGVQKLSPDGQLLWGDMGVAITRADGMPDYPLYIERMFSDGNGGAYLVNCVGDAGYATSLYLQHVDASGNLSWPDDGVQLLDHDCSTILLEAVQLDDGSIILVYRLYQSLQSNLYAHRFSLDGNPMWPNPVELIDLVNPYTYVRGYEVKQVGEHVVAAIHASDGSYQNRILWVQAIDESGDVVWEDDPMEFISESYLTNAITLAPASESTFWLGIRTNTGFEVNQYDFQQQAQLGQPLELASSSMIFSYPMMVADDNGGVFVCWQGGEMWEDTDLMFTHLANDGSLAQPDYSYAGVFLSGAIYQQEQLYVTSDGEGGMLAVWNDFRGRIGALEGDDVYAMRINETVTGVNPTPVAHLPEWELYPVYPNPFNPSTQVTFTLAAQADVNVAVYDVLGRHVTTLVRDVMIAGAHQTVWDGTSANGSPVASGIYFIRMETPDLVKSQKAILMK